MTALGRWDAHHADLQEPLLYGSRTYEMAADFLASCPVVEDWGCGGGGFTAYRPDGYVGVDASATPYASVRADLTQYRSPNYPSGILVRHVLEHSHDWLAILNNALASFLDRLCIVVFTPWEKTTRVLDTEPDYGDVPVIGFAPEDVLLPVIEQRPSVLGVESIRSPDTAYGIEHVITVVAWALP